MESGTRLGPYEILEQLGAGGMGEVYLAQDTRLGRKVAVKVLPAQFASDRERLARFEQEARAAAALNHPHIAVVHDIGHEGDTHYIVQEYLEGESLEETVARGALPGKKVLALGEQIARALAVAHAAGIVHRDLKPANIFVTPDGSAKVLDFGLAKLTDAGTAAGGADASLSPTVMGTMAGTVMGTAGYMAPEQVHGEEVDRRADLFAFGCVLYEMVTGQRAFDGQSVPDTLAKVLHSEPELIDAPASVAPAELDRILRKCLMKEAAARYQYADDLAVDLGSLATAMETDKGDVGAMAGAGAGAGGAVSTDLAVEGGVPRARALGLAAGVAIASIVLTAVAMWSVRTPPPPSPLRTFTIPFPEQHPAAGICCASNLAITPDESRLLFVAREGTGGAWNFYNYRFTTGETRQLEGLNGYNPTISPDGTEFAYVHLPLPADRRQGEEARLVRVETAGGSPFDLGVEGFGAPAWGTDDRIYVGFRRFGGRDVARLPATGGESDLLAPNDLGEGVTIRRVVPVPDRGFMLLELVEGLEARIAALDLATMDLHELVPEGRDPRLTSTGHLLFHRAGVVHAVPLSDDGKQLLGAPVPVLQGVMVGIQGSAQFTVSDSGTLAWVPGVVAGGVSRRMLSVDGEGESQLILPDVDAYFSPRLSPDGGRVLFAIGSFRTREYNLWIHDLDLDSTSALTDDDGSSSGVWSADGEWIYYSRATEGEPGDIWRFRADGAGRAEAVLELAGEQHPVSITADGRSLLYRERSRGEERVSYAYSLLALENGETTPLIEDVRGMEGRLSPDGQLLAYQSDDSGFLQVYVLDLASGGARHAVTPGRVAARAPVWTPDGSELVFSGSTDDSRNLYRLRIGRSTTGALEISAPEEQPVVGTPNWQVEDFWPDGRLLAMDSERSNAAVGDTDTIRVTLDWFQELERLAPRR